MSDDRELLLRYEALKAEVIRITGDPCRWCGKPPKKHRSMTGLISCATVLRRAEPAEVPQT